MNDPKRRFAVQAAVWAMGLMVAVAWGAGDHDAEAPARVPGVVSTKPVDLTPAALFRTGLAYEEAVKQLGGEGEELRRMKVEKVTYRWSDPRGASFICRFEDGKLVQKTAFRTGSRQVTGKKPLLNKADHEALKPGTPLRQALRIQPAPKRVSASTVEVIYYRWTDRAGKTFVGRFENGKLRQNTGRETAARAKAKLAKRKAKAQKSAPSAENPGPVSDPGTVAPEAAGVDGGAETTRSEAPLAEDGEEPSPAPGPDAFAGEETRGEALSEAVAEAPSAPEAAAEEEYEPRPEPAPGPRVHVAGASRRQREADRPSGRLRPARLPEFRHSLRRGSYEILVRNPTRVQVTLGLRAEGKGRDATLPPGGTVSFFVDQGVYSLYFIYRDDPHTLLQGPAIALGGLRLPDAEVLLDGGDGYSVRVLEGTSTHRR